MGKRRTSTAQRPVLPGDADMLGTLAKRRSTPRVPTRRIAWITFTSWLEHEHLALVKDISERGVFFSSDFRPAVGDQLDFVVEFLILITPQPWGTSAGNDLAWVFEFLGGSGCGFCVGSQGERARRSALIVLSHCLRFIGALPGDTV